MKSYKQVLLSAVCATFFLGAANVFAEEENADKNEFLSNIASGENVVLFKVHDIKPLKDAEGAVTDCEFSLTLYNRSPKSIDDATMQLSWLDEGVSEVIDEEEEQDINNIVSESSKQNFINNPQSNVTQPKTEDLVSRNLVTTVVLPKIKPFRQVSLKSKVKSDRCFLMINNAEYSFTSCSISESETGGRRLSTAGQGNSSCQSLFRFVSPRDPEYYREFQKVSFNEEAEKRKEARKKDINELEESYTKMIDSLNETSNVLNSIQ